MKARQSPQRSNTPQPAEDRLQSLAEAVACLSGSAEVRAFLEDLCTPAELEAMADRWRVVPLLLEGVPYREIHERTDVSTTTVTRVARSLERGAGGYRAAAARLRKPRARSNGKRA